ncbi:epoxyqueuosine reductase [Ruminococcus sp. OA3]|uniref:epoxyqueuosine reductase n=1 Tax=Ruminococcus sp. OA3 TaxID=2914164 RepID=UPI001F06A931|nr:epoxyqueuosine reductase [Ruminococcus sp. OA3]MCH1981420.1 epoxyqueuosine reductase [Ruminococcus sp. OA3]
MDLRTDIEQELYEFVRTYDASGPLQDKWGKPLVGFADVEHPYIRQLPGIVHKLHQMPREVMPDATVIMVYFVPFQPWVAKGNRQGEMASADWAQIYEATNAMFLRLNEHMIRFLESRGYRGAVSPQSTVFYRDELVSHWSFRHFAYAAGLGTFGLNNMLITESGCAGRLNALVTNLDVTAGEPRTEEACLYRRNKSCGVCVSRCPAGALTTEGYDRHRCFAQCLKNAAVYTQFGNSYASTEGEEAADSGSEVCGKCLSGLPCTQRRP